MSFFCELIIALHNPQPIAEVKLATVDTARTEVRVDPAVRPDAAAPAGMVALDRMAELEVRAAPPLDKYGGRRKSSK